MALAVTALVLATSAAPKPHIISILQDDLGYYDTGIHSEAAAKFTQNITALAREGIVLTNHYTVSATTVRNKCMKSVFNR